MSYELKRIGELLEFYHDSTDENTKKRLIVEAYNLTAILQDEEKRHPSVSLVASLYEMNNKI